MKKLRMFFIMMSLAMTTTAFAQGESATWKSVFVEYERPTLDPKKGSKIDFDGVTIGVTRSFTWSDTTPLFLEVGAGLNCLFEKGEETIEGVKVEDETSMVAIKVPVNFIYHWTFDNSKVSLVAYSGLDLRYFFDGEYKLTTNGTSKTYNIFKKEEMGETMTGTFNRFYMAWRAGVGVRFNNKWQVSLAYSRDVTKLAKECKTDGLYVAAAYCF